MVFRNTCSPRTSPTAGFTPTPPSASIARSPRGCPRGAFCARRCGNGSSWRARSATRVRRARRTTSGSTGAPSPSSRAASRCAGCSTGARAPGRSERAVGCEVSGAVGAVRAPLSGGYQALRRLLRGARILGGLGLESESFQELAQRVHGAPLHHLERDAHFAPSKGPKDLQERPFLRVPLRVERGARYRARGPFAQRCFVNFAFQDETRCRRLETTHHGHPTCARATARPEKSPERPISASPTSAPVMTA